MAKIRMDAEFGWYVGFRFTHESVRVSGGESSFFIGPFASHAAAAIWVIILQARAHPEFGPQVEQPIGYRRAIYEGMTPQNCGIPERVHFEFEWEEERAWSGATWVA
jgi:hypothetical protein